ncbi:MAG: hypothetical protein LBQ50_12315 [Planctomycetaceae bacterium]|jgi:hypothetical protein|nr:hypothetical protein [Planctomycetaceae bacterium]
MIDSEQKEVWFITGAQLLYGGETIQYVDNHSTIIVDELNRFGKLPFKIVHKCFYCFGFCENFVTVYFVFQVFARRHEEHKEELLVLSTDFTD